MKKILILIGIVFLIILLFLVNKNKRDYEFNIEHNEIIRTYGLHIPESYNKNATPLVIYLHGGGGNIDSAYKDEIDKMSDKYGFILAIPEGTGEKN